ATAEPVAAAEPAPLPPELQGTAPSDIWQRLKFEADGRVRGESTFDQPNGVDRHRGRLRFRVGGTYQVMEGVTAGARLTTVSDSRDANNPHWDFGDTSTGGSDSFTGSEVGIDRVYLDWAALENLNVGAGKFGDPYSRPPITSEFAWDNDVQPAGAYGTWKPKKDGKLGFDVRGVAGVAAEVNAVGTSGTDAVFVGAQGNLYFDLTEAMQLQASTSYTDWSGLSNFTLSQGNTLAAGGFSIWDSFVSATHKGGALGQIRGYGQYLLNMDDDSGEDTGFTLGAQVGKTSGKGALNGFAAFYTLDANCLFSAVAQDDTPIAGTGNGTGMDGFLVGGQYFIRDNFSVRLWALTSDADAADDPYRIRLDFDFRVL
ncbi:MAG TPA: putative porin, partial [Planctomycetota bacterium]|nr:putative porin [Planctomycetota bacterium]